MKIKLLLLFSLLSLAANAQIINIPDANFKDRLVYSAPGNSYAKDLNGNYFAIDANGDGEIQVSEAEQVGGLYIEVTSTVFNNINSLTGIEYFNNLTEFEFIGSNSYLSNTPSGVTTINLSNKPNLKRLILTKNYYLTDLNISGSTGLQYLTCSGNIDFSSMTSIDLTGLSSLKELDISFNQINNIVNLNDCVNLEKLNVAYNKFVSIDINSLHKLGYAVFANNPLLEYLFMKNGVLNYDPASVSSSTFEVVEGLNYVKYVCCDDNELAAFTDAFANFTGSLNNVHLNTYCSFVPGGNYNTITGTVRFDENNNGCDTNDEFFEHMKLKINDGTNTGETFVKNNGKFDFYTQAGSFTVTAEPENPVLFTVTPSIFTTSFPNNNNNIFNQNICVTKNGNANDLEVVIAPETNATPGFDAKYKLMWRNKGNTTLSGNVTLTFDSSKMNFISSTLPYASIAGNHITFNFTNLKPYGNTVTEIVFNINTPSHPTNPVNSGDILNFSAVVNPLVGDIKPEDNSFSYKQAVVNSFDPNDIVCIEGNSIPQSMVGKYLHYIVNFENTGTAPATNIVVEMDVDPNDFDISTLQLQNTSHQVYTRVRDNKVEFIMEYANLGNGGHGNVLMKMVSKNTLTSGDSVNNKANIYFDYNFPIVTNDAVTTIENGGVLQASEAKTDHSITIYPIPTKGEVNINADSKINSVEVYDAQGRIIQKQIGINSQNTKLTIHSNSSGVFLLKMNTEKGILMKKVIKN